MTAQESESFGDAVAGVLRAHWGGPTAAASADLALLWDQGAKHGWFELGSAGALSAAMRAVRELGRVACPLPVMDGFVASCLLANVAPLLSGIESGEIRVVVAMAKGSGATSDYLEAVPSSTHVVLLRPESGSLELCAIHGWVDLPGVAVPNWSRVVLDEPQASLDLSPSQLDEALSLLRLGLAGRAVGAAERAHEMAIEHAKSRHQFGRPIGSFGAVQQRTAECQIEIRAGNLLIEDAVRSWEMSEPDAMLRAEIAVEHARSAAPFVQLGAQHTLGASGYFEEHEAPWLFRRVHADVARLGSYESAGGEVADILIARRSSLPALSVGEAGERIRDEVRELLRQFPSVAIPAGESRAPAVNTALVSAVAEQGWLGFGWPPKYGGRSASLSEVIALYDEAAYSRAPLGTALSAVMLVGHSIIRHGTTAQQARFLPLIRRGELSFCLGYSEPDVGSDLAALRTRAVRVGDDWVVNGQKSWTTGGHVAEWMWLAARTDPDSTPPQAGITVFLFPMSTEGITVQQHRALSGDVSCSVYFDDVRISDAARIGEVNGGWKVIIDALAGERISMGSSVASGLHRQLDELLAIVREDTENVIGPRGSARRARLGALAVRVQATRVLVAAAIEAAMTGDGHPHDAPMASVLGGELAEEFGESVLQILGPSAALREMPGAPRADFDYGLRLSVKYVVGGGTNDIQRGLIARNLGLPR